METKRCIERAHMDHDNRTLIEEFVLAGSWREKVLLMCRTMSWQAFGVYSSGRVLIDYYEVFGVAIFIFRTIDHLAA